MPACPIMACLLWARPTAFQLDLRPAPQEEVCTVSQERNKTNPPTKHTKIMLGRSKVPKGKQLLLVYQTKVMSSRLLNMLLMHRNNHCCQPQLLTTSDALENKCLENLWHSGLQFSDQILQHGRQLQLLAAHGSGVIVEERAKECKNRRKGWSIVKQVTLRLKQSILKKWSLRR